MTNNAFKTLTYDKHNAFTFVVDQHEPGMVGVPGLCSFQIQITGPLGQTFTLHFTHKRPWESQPIAEYQVKL